MNLIFVCSYLNTTDVIDTIEYENSDFRILTANDKLLILFSDLFGAKHVIKLPQLFNSFRNIINFFHDIIRLPGLKKRVSLIRCQWSQFQLLEIN